MNVARWLLVALPLVMPFEVPLFRIGPLTITTVELALYLTLAAWLPTVRPRHLLRDPMAWAVASFMVAVAISAAVTPSTAKVALRLIGGALLFFAARDQAPRRAVALAILAGAAVSALPIPWPWPTETFTALGFPRSSGPFEYPTLAAMYWEAALPLGALLLVPRRTWARGAAVAVVAAVLSAAIVASATRSALAGALVASAALLVIGRGVRVAGGILVVVVAAFGAVALVSPGSLFGERLRGGRWYGATYLLGETQLTIAAGSEGTAALTLTNTGSLTWPAGGDDGVHVGYHWELLDGQLVVLDGKRTLLPADVAPGASIRVAAVFGAPAQPGRYRLRWDLVREHRAWFSEHGTATADQIVEVVGVASAPPPPTAGRLDDGIRERPTRLELWRAALALWRRHPIAGVGPDNFRHLYPQVLPRGKRYLPDERLHANSLYLETLADLGALGVLALALLAAALGRTLLRARGEGLVCSMAAATFFIHGVVDAFLTFTPLYTLSWLLYGLAAQRDP